MRREQMHGRAAISRIEATGIDNVLGRLALKSHRNNLSRSDLRKKLDYYPGRLAYRRPQGLWISTPF
jgi:hypothetical protein